MEWFSLVLVNYLGYFFVMIIFGIIATIGAKKQSTWIYYGIGAVVQLLSLLGGQKQANYRGEDMTIEWFLYFALLALFAVLIAMRKSAAYYDGCGKKNKRTLVKKEAEQGKIPDEDANVGAIPAMINTKENGKEDSKAHSWNLTVSIVLSALSCAAIIVAMNVQDGRRNILEAISPTIIYSVLFGLNIVCLLGLIVFEKTRFKSVGKWLSLLPAMATITVLIEGSAFSSTTNRFVPYIHGNAVVVCNCVWVIASFIVALIAALTLLANKKNAYYLSVRYREKCYKRIAKLHTYLNEGIISQEEYEKARADILKKVK